MQLKLELILVGDFGDSLEERAYNYSYALALVDAYNTIGGLMFNSRVANELLRGEQLCTSAPDKLLQSRLSHTICVAHGHLITFALLLEQLGR